MKVIDRIRDEALSLSFEVFPPKSGAAFDGVMGAAAEIARLRPSYISVTYGAGGAGSRYTAEIARRLQQTEDVPVLAHLTCVGADRETIRAYLKTLREDGICNLMALRGDLPEGMTPDTMRDSPYPHASDLIREIRQSGDLCIGAACYPEIHPESANQQQDLRSLREKVEAGADFLTTQMFFDNDVFYNFMYKLREAGIAVPVVPGIMPITSPTQVERARKLSGSFMPRRFTNLVDHFGSSPEATKQAGILYAADQIIDLFANGIRHVHIYTMNKPDVAAAIQGHLSQMLGRTF